MTRMLLLAATCVAALVLAAPAAGRFGAPRAVTPAGVRASDGEVAVGERRRVAAIWTEDVVRQGHTIGTRVRARLGTPRALGRTWELSTRRLRSFSAYGDVAVGPDGTVAALWREFHGPSTTFKAAVAPPGRGFGPAQTLLRGRGATGLEEIAVDRTGRVVALGGVMLPDGTQRLLYAEAPPGGRFGAPTTVDAAATRFDVSTVLTSTGALLATWTDLDGRALVAERAPGTAGFGPPSELARDLVAFEDNPVISAGPGGEAVAFINLEPAANRVAKLALRRPDGSFAAPATLDAVNSVNEATGLSFPSVAVAADRAAVAIWAHSDVRRGSAFNLVRARVVDANGVAGPAVTLSRAHTKIGGHAAAAVGDAALLAWGEDVSDSRARLRYTVRRAGAPVGRPMALARGGAVTGARLDAAGDTAVASWIDRPPHRLRRLMMAVYTELEPCGRAGVGYTYAEVRAANVDCRRARRLVTRWTTTDDAVCVTKDKPCRVTRLAGFRCVLGGSRAVARLRCTKRDQTVVGVWGD